MCSTPFQDEKAEPSTEELQQPASVQVVSTQAPPENWLRKSNFGAPPATSAEAAASLATAPPRAERLRLGGASPIGVGGGGTSGGAFGLAILEKRGAWYSPSSTSDRGVRGPGDSASSPPPPPPPALGGPRGDPPPRRSRSCQNLYRKRVPTFATVQTTAKDSSAGPTSSNSSAPLPTPAEAPAATERRRKMASLEAKAVATQSITVLIRQPRRSAFFSASVAATADQPPPSRADVAAASFLRST
mmetsp:Transcript_130577/g.418671  ORF Transcript_130577/g.418671 Transcript_130577/m.418671 type:complete len:245 (+) Transcript_130577:282-1016(+)